MRCSYIKIVIVFTVFSISVAGCNMIFHRGTVRFSSINRQGQSIAIGFVENRDSGYNPFADRNFSDMLAYELIQLGFQTVNIDYEQLKAENEIEKDDPDDKNNRDMMHTNDPVDRESDSDAEKSTDSTLENANTVANENSDAVLVGDENGQTTTDPADRVLDYYDREHMHRTTDYASSDLFPERYRDVAGEFQSEKYEAEPSGRLLLPSEIAILRSTNQFDYFVQGAISRTETGVLIEFEEHTSVYLLIYGRDGQPVGAVNFVETSSSLRDPSFLQDVVARMALAIAELHEGTASGEL